MIQTFGEEPLGTIALYFVLHLFTIPIVFLSYFGLVFVKNKFKKKNKKETIEKKNLTPSSSTDNAIDKFMEGLRLAAYGNNYSISNRLIHCSFKVTDSNDFLWYFKSRLNDNTYLILHYIEDIGETIISKIDESINTPEIDEIMVNLSEKINYLSMLRLGKDVENLPKLKPNPKQKFENNSLETIMNDDPILSKANELMNSFEEISKNKQYLNIEELHMLSDTFVKDTKKVAEMYLSISKDMRDRTTGQFLSILQKIEEYRDNIKSLSEQRQEDELKKMYAIVKNRINIYE